jgi:hypothetical protein
METLAMTVALLTSWLLALVARPRARTAPVRKR